MEQTPNPAFAGVSQSLTPQGVQDRVPNDYPIVTRPPVICICDYQINITMQQFAYTGRSLVHKHGIATLGYASTSSQFRNQKEKKRAYGRGAEDSRHAALLEALQNWQITFKRANANTPNQICAMYCVGLDVAS